MENTELGDHKRNNQFQVLIDSDAFVGWMVERDAHHQQARHIFHQLKERQSRLVTTSFVVAETVTVLSHRSGQPLARAFLDEAIEDGNFPFIFIARELYQQALEIFKKQSKKGTSVTDCANVAVARYFHIPTIFSFDKVYAKRFGLKLASA
jgi:predicted nucleic acid-binding protein